MKQSKGLRRNTIDKYYTKPSIVEFCLNLVKTHVAIGETDMIIEPSAGNGAFLEGIRSLSSRHAFYDIQPEHPAITQQDYLTLDWRDLKRDVSKIHIIGNPPFGRQSSAAIKFIKKSCEFCDTISFILPKSFKKDSMKRTFPLAFHLVVETDLPEKAFLVDGEEHDVPCVFQIWERRAHDRLVQTKLEPINFHFVNKSDLPDASVRRVGVNAGTVSTEVEEKSAQSHYFIRFEKGSIGSNIQKLSTITYEFNNTVGPKSISKQELIQKFNSVLM